MHRDLKPSNLFITTRPDGSPAIKVIDFGISKIAPRAGEALEMTKTAESRGSPLFMSPEQMTSPRAMDARTDIWALGITLYHLLTGGYPFYAATLPELCGLVLQTEPASLRMRRPDLPPGLEAFIARCLRKNPAERYANMAELAAALGEFAPPLARLSVDRIFRVLGASAGQGHHLPASLPANGSTAHTSGELPAPPPRAPFPSTSTVASLTAASPGATMHAQTGAVFSGTTRSLAPKHTVLVVAALSFIGMIAVVAIVLVLRMNGQSVPDPQPASALLSETASASPSAASSPVIAAPVEVRPAALPAPAELPAPAPSSPTPPPAELLASAAAALPALAPSSSPVRPSPLPRAGPVQPGPSPKPAVLVPAKKTAVNKEPF